MFGRLLRYWILIPLLIVAVIAREWLDPPFEEALEATIDMAATQADYYLEKFETRKFDRSGRIQYVIEGATLTHYPADDSSEIIEPVMMMHQPQGIWTVDSPRGRLTTKPDIFTLEGTVIMNHLATDRSGSIRIKTSDLRIHTARNFVETDKPIEVTSDTWVLRSVGLESFIDQGKLTLLSRVEGRYEINN